MQILGSVGQSSQGSLGSSETWASHVSRSQDGDAAHAPSPSPFPLPEECMGAEGCEVSALAAARRILDLGSSPKLQSVEAAIADCRSFAYGKPQQSPYSEKAGQSDSKNHRVRATGPRRRRGLAAWRRPQLCTAALRSLKRREVPSTFVDVEGCRPVTKSQRSWFCKAESHLVT